MPKRIYYAVKVGRMPGVYSSWKECNQQVKDFNGATFKKFATEIEATAYVGDRDDSSLGLSMASDIAITRTGTKRPLSPEFENQDPEDVVYCDGACKGNGRNASTAGIGVWWDDNDPRNLSERCPGDQTNNRAELVAIARVLETAPISTVPLTIKTDSQYSCSCLESWLPSWEKNDYKTAGGQPVKNIDLIKYVKALLDARRQDGQRVKLEHVRGHSGIIGNEGADGLANHGTALPREQERQWKVLEKDVRRMMAAKNTKLSSADSISKSPEDVPKKIRKVSLDELESSLVSPSSSPSARASPIRLPFSPSSKDGLERDFRYNTKSNQPTPALHIVVDPEDIDLKLYVDCLLEEDKIGEDLQD